MTLVWMLANVGDLLALDTEYLWSLFKPAAKWGEQTPHDSQVGIFEYAQLKDRTPPKPDDPQTHETIHPSAMCQKVIRPEISTLVQQHPEIVWKLLPFEESIREKWPFKPGERDSTDKITVETASKEQQEQKSFLEQAQKGAKNMMSPITGIKDAQMHDPEEPMLFRGVKIVSHMHRNTWFGGIIDSVLE